MAISARGLAVFAKIFADRLQDNFEKCIDAYGANVTSRLQQASQYVFDVSF